VPRTVIGAHLNEADPGRATLRVHPVPPDLAFSTTVMIWHRARSHQPARQAFADCLAEQLGDPMEHATQ